MNTPSKPAVINLKVKTNHGRKPMISNMSFSRCNTDKISLENPIGKIEVFGTGHEECKERVETKHVK